MNRTDLLARIVLGVFALTCLIAIFVGQKINIAAFFGVNDGIAQFLVNRSIRFFLNDALTILLLYAIFYNRKAVLFAVYTQLAGTLFLFVPYCLLKIAFPIYDGPLISFLHRLVINPVILLLLIPALHLREKQNTHQS